MKNSKILDILILVMLAAWIVIASGKIFGISFYEDSSEVEESSDISLYVYDYFTGADRWKETDVSTYEIYSGRRKTGTILLSEPYTSSVKGYIGSTPLLIALDGDDSVVAVRLLDNYESPDYVARVLQSGLTESWNGLPAKEVSTTSVDAVSGATYTSRAIVETMQKRMSLYSESEYAKSATPGKIAADIAILILLAAAVFVCYSKKVDKKRLRSIILLLSIAVLGIWQGRMLSVATLLSWIANGIPWSVQLVLGVMAIAAVILPLFTGKAFYCMWICPFGAAQELIGRAKATKWKLKRSFIKWAKIFKRAVLYAGLILIAAGVAFDFNYIEPFTAFRPQAASISAIVIAVVSLILSVFIPHPWCRFVCPLGEVLETVRIGKGGN